MGQRHMAMIEAGEDVLILKRASASRSSSCCRPAMPNLCSFSSMRSERGKPKSAESHQSNYRYTTKLHNVLDGLAMNLEKGYRPTRDFIIEDADYQPAGIPSLCIEVCPTFYRDWTIPELVCCSPRTTGHGHGLP